MENNNYILHFINIFSENFISLNIKNFVYYRLFTGEFKIDETLFFSQFLYLCRFFLHSRCEFQDFFTVYTIERVISPLLNEQKS